MFFSGFTLLFPFLNTVWGLFYLTKQGQLISKKAESFTGSKTASIYGITFLHILS